MAFKRVRYYHRPSEAKFHSTVSKKRRAKAVIFVTTIDPVKHFKAQIITVYLPINFSEEIQVVHSTPTTSSFF